MAARDLEAHVTGRPAEGEGLYGFSKRAAGGQGDRPGRGEADPICRQRDIESSRVTVNVKCMNCVRIVPNVDVRESERATQIENDAVGESISVIGLKVGPVMTVDPETARMGLG